MAEVHKIALICNFIAETCCNCGIAFAVDSEVRARWQRDGSSFYCPNGHSQHYTESDVQRLKKQLETAERHKKWAQDNAAAERAARERTERRLTATKGAKTRLRNRIKNGVCPCCTRSFMNLKAHIATKHPGFKADEDVRPSDNSGSATMISHVLSFWIACFVAWLSLAILLYRNR